MSTLIKSLATFTIAILLAANIFADVTPADKDYVHSVANRVSHALIPDSSQGVVQTTGGSHESYTPLCRLDVSLQFRARALEHKGGQCGKSFWRSIDRK
jgi:hypothetical protein